MWYMHWFVAWYSYSDCQSISLCCKKFCTVNVWGLFSCLKMEPVISKSGKQMDRLIVFLWGMSICLKLRIVVFIVIPIIVCFDNISFSLVPDRMYLYGNQWMQEIHVEDSRKLIRSHRWWLWIDLPDLLRAWHSASTSAHRTKTRARNVIAHISSKCPPFLPIQLKQMAN